MTFFTFARVVFGPLIRLLYRVKTENLEELKKYKGKGFILCSNHISYIDPVVLGGSCRRDISYMGKEELFRKKFFGFILKKLGAFPVSRGKGDTSAIETSVNVLKNGGVLGIFPEGTRGNGKEMLRLKSGTMVIAAQTDADIIPVIIKSKDNVKVFRRTNIIFGTAIKHEELGIDKENLRTMRQATKILAERMQKIYDKE